MVVEEEGENGRERERERERERGRERDRDRERMYKFTTKMLVIYTVNFFHKAPSISRSSADAVLKLKLVM